MAIIDGSGTAVATSDAHGIPTLSYVTPVGTAAARGGASGNLVELVPPRLVSVAPTSSTSIRVTFSEGMKTNTALLDPISYSIQPNQIGAAGVLVLGVTPQAVSLPTYVDLTVTEQTNGASYRLTVSGVSDPSDNPIDPDFNNATFTGTGTLPQLTSISTISSNRVRFAFSEPMLNNLALKTPSNYLLMPVTPGAAPLFFDTVDPQGVDFPTYVDVPCSEMTNGASYQGGVVTPTMSDKVNNPVDGAHTTATFTGLGTPPSVKEIHAISQNRVDVIFSEPMLDNADIRNPAKYTWSGGLSTLSVLDVLSDTVSLVTSDQTPNTLYDLSVAP